jgi:MFS transporter, PPP family, 3-phenylpropionic acid transporter
MEGLLIYMQSQSIFETAVPPKKISLYKTLYFMIWAAAGLYLPYINLYYQSINLSGTQIGLICTFAPLMGAAGSTFWGILSDRTGQTKRLFAIASAGTAACALTLTQTQNFMLILFISSTMSFFSVAMFSLLDSATLRFLGIHSQEYGRYRMWGTIGFIVTNTLNGFLLERFGLRLIFFTYPVALMIFLAITQILPNRATYMSQNTFRGLNQMVRRPQWVLFMLSVFIVWFAVSGPGNFLSVTINERGGGSGLVGITYTIAALAEIPFFFFSAFILKKVGATRLVIISFIMYAIRILLYAVIQNPNWIPMISLMQGISFSPYLVGSVAYANDHAPEDLKATSQGLLASVNSTANMAGSFTAGRLFDSIGPSGMYGFMSFVAFVGFFVFFIGRKILAPKSVQNQPVI